MTSHKSAAIAACVVTNFLIMLTISPLSAIMPTIADFFHVDPGTAGWVQTAYLLILASSLLVAGRLGDLYGHRNVYLAGIVLYTGVGTLCGFVQDFGALIALRLAQGVGGALISGNSLAIITNTFTAKDRGVAIGIIGMSASFGGLLGIVLSVSLAQYLNWQWLFYVTLPVGLVAMVAGRNLPGDTRAKDPPKVDLLGAALLAATLSVFSLAFSHLHAGEASSSEGWRYHGGLLAATIMGLLLFAAVERRASQPMVDLTALRNATFSFSLVANLILRTTMMSSFFLMPFLIEKGLGLSPAHVGAALIAMSAGKMLGSPLSGRVYDRTRWRFLCPVAMGLVAIGLAIMGFLAPSWPFVLLMAASLGLGVTVGFFDTPNNVIIMSEAPAHLRGFAAGILETSRQFGNMIGVSISGAIMAAAVVGAAPGPAGSAAYILGFRQASAAAAGMAFIGIFVSLVHALSRRARAEMPPVPTAS
ncbi:MAG: MFS transporter [Chloroflexi bacterium]|nr:MFS transporter [Chloroflexota bacterium]